MERALQAEEREECANRAAPIKAAAREAFRATVPVLFGFFFCGLSYGVVISALGIPPWVAPLSTVLVFQGSLEFILAGMMAAPFAPVEAVVVSLVISARHALFGISMLEKYRRVGRKKAFLLYGLCDESFALNYPATEKPGVDIGWRYAFTTMFCLLYWVVPSTIGAYAGTSLDVDLAGLDFVMIALFLTLFVDSWKSERDHTASLLGLGISAACLLVIGADGFLLPAMALIIGALFACRGRIAARAVCGQGVDERG